MLPETFAADTCFPSFFQFCHTGICFCREGETVFAAGNNASRVAKLENIGKHVSAANVSGNMFHFAWALD